ncbi:MAG: PilN domain-containing protein [Gemmatimonadota bacterium]|nr:PilN domain-containing protein [Gemmatimonadota bacterium]
MNPVRINLVPGERRERRRRPGLPSIPAPAAEWLPRSPSVVVGVLGLIVVLALVFLYFEERSEVSEARAAIEEAEADSARLHSELVRVRSMEEAQERLAGRVEMLENVVEGRLYWIETMEVLSRVLPEYTWLRAIDREDLGPDRMRISGATFSNAAVTEYMRDLESSPQLADVSLVGVSRAETDSISYQEFTIVADFEDYRTAVITPADTAAQEGE